MLKQIEMAIARCKPLNVTTLLNFLKPALSMDKTELLNLRGHANSILVAQFMAYAKTRADFAEELMLDENALQQAKNAIQRNTVTSLL